MGEQNWSIFWNIWKYLINWNIFLKNWNNYSTDTPNEFNLKCQGTTSFQLQYYCYNSIILYYFILLKNHFNNSIILYYFILLKNYFYNSIILFYFIYLKNNSFGHVGYNSFLKVNSGGCTYPPFLRWPIVIGCENTYITHFIFLEATCCFVSGGTGNTVSNTNLS